MNRRQFNFGLVTLATSPALPALPAAATASATAAAPFDIAAMYYPWAVRYARVHGQASPAVLERALQVAPDIARTLCSRLQTRGIVAAPGVGGISKALDPVGFDLQYAGRSAAQQAQTAATRATTNPGHGDITDDPGEARASQRPQERDDEACQQADAEVERDADAHEIGEPIAAGPVDEHVGLIADRRGKGG